MPSITSCLLSSLAQSIRAGSFYEHYKGPHYKILAVANHTETLEELVVYQDEKGGVWVRPLTMFLEEIIMDGRSRPRFKLVE